MVSIEETVKISLSHNQSINEPVPSSFGMADDTPPSERYLLDQIKNMIHHQKQISNHFLDDEISLNQQFYEEQANEMLAGLKDATP